jgi:hypothetical protein
MVRERPVQPTLSTPIAAERFQPSLPTGEVGRRSGKCSPPFARQCASPSTPVRRVECGRDVVARLRSATKGDVVVEVEQVEPGCNVLAILIKVADALGEELQRFNIAVRAALAEIGAPLLNFPGGTPVRRVLLNPGEYFTVAFAGGKLSFQCFRSYPCKTEPVIIRLVVVFEFTRGPGKLGPTLVKDAWENDIAAQTHAWAAGRTLVKIRRVSQGFVHGGNVRRLARIFTDFFAAFYCRCITSVQSFGYSPVAVGETRRCARILLVKAQHCWFRSRS